MLQLFTATIFTSACLLFLVQPMFGRMVLPLLGGAPSVWNAALVFYQAALLCGYAYAHVATRLLGVRRHSVIHVALMLVSAVCLPVHVPDGWTPAAGWNPALWTLALMTAAIGLPFVAVSASSPLLQRWFAATKHAYSGDPYFLYCTSNLGSMIALILYPVAIEPSLDLRTQGWWWTGGYALLAVLMGLCALAVWLSTREPGVDERAGRNAVAGREMSPSGPAAGRSNTAVPTILERVERLRWVALAFVPSSLMLSVTNHLTTDIAAMPLVWVIPLSIYLLSFVIAFARRPVMSHSSVLRAVAPSVLILAAFLSAGIAEPLALVLPLHLAVFFVVAVACHGELSKRRPGPERLTGFYLLVSTGGVLGSAFNTLLGPVLFDSFAEYPLVLALVCVLLPAWSTPAGRRWERTLDLVWPAVLAILTVALMSRVRSVNPNPGQFTALIVFGLPALVCISFSRRPLRLGLGVGGILLASNLYAGSQGQVLYVERSFFGVTRITRDASGQFNQIVHGNTLHGGQWLVPVLRREPVTYYHRNGPLGQFLAILWERRKPRNVAVIGLGSGAVSCYAEGGQNWTYYEIDPAVSRIAQDTRFFTYLSDCRAHVKIVLGDGRLAIAEAADGFYDLILLDAYSSDSLPAHLLTREAIRLYFRKLAPRGVVVFHISNRYLDIEPVLGNLARDAGLVALTRYDAGASESGAELGKSPSKYLVMLGTRDDLANLARASHWVRAAERPALGVWTDNYSSILGILKWHR